MNKSAKSRPKVGLFVTCLVDAMRPAVGFASVRVLESAGVEVSIPERQTCCGQPAFNSGAAAEAQKIAKQTIELFEGFDYVVAPSGSCAGTFKHHYPEMFKDDPDWLARAGAMAVKVYEITDFLFSVIGWRPKGVSLDATATYHDSCSGLRELGIHAQPRALLSVIDGLSMQPLRGAEKCCGFGGTFCVKYPDISAAIVSEKTTRICETGADLLLAGDLGCLMNMAGKLSREDAGVRCFHVVEALAGMADGDGI